MPDEIRTQDRREMVYALTMYDEEGGSELLGVFHQESDAEEEGLLITDRRPALRFGVEEFQLL